jgi:KipI family sensor histidine kinase inhibitor
MTEPRIREAGDSALLLELDDRIDPAVNARAISVAASVRAEALPGVRDVVPTYRSVAVYFDPLRSDRDALRAALVRGLERPAVVTRGRSVEIPVTYGGEGGPDLDAVASWAGMSAEAVVACHTDRAYRVFMLGFLPGFAYLGSVDDAIAAPRRESPRVRVPAGSVGIAGRQTGIYPRDSPGGWQIVGHTATRVFDAGWDPPAILRPGDSVRFVAARGATPGNAPDTSQVDGHRARAGRVITVLRPGLFTTVQDEGRWGEQASGVPVSGPLDASSHHRANRAVGNPRDAATLEATIVGPELRVEQPAWMAVAGADLQASVDGAAVIPGRPVRCGAGSIVRFGERRSGARAYIAFDGGFDVPRVLGSRATHVGAGLGGVHGRALRAGDELALGEGSGGTPRAVDAPPNPSGGARLRVLPGPQDHAFSAEALHLLECTRFVVTPRSDRMGYRLSGASLPGRDGREMISDAAFTGGIQVPSSGDPILLVADRQTTGGYPQIATVITADLPLAGQLAPGDWVEFTRCSLDEALAALAAQEAEAGGTA